MIETIEDAQYELNVMIQEAAADSGMTDDDIARDMLVSFVFMYPLEDSLALELCRRELGYVPFELRASLGEHDFLES